MNLVHICLIFLIILLIIYLTYPQKEYSCNMPCDDDSICVLSSKSGKGDNCTKCLPSQSGETTCQEPSNPPPPPPKPPPSPPKPPPQPSPSESKKKKSLILIIAAFIVSGLLAIGLCIGCGSLYRKRAGAGAGAGAVAGAEQLLPDLLDPDIADHSGRIVSDQNGAADAVANSLSSVMSNDFPNHFNPEDTPRYTRIELENMMKLIDQNLLVGTAVTGAAIAAGFASSPGMVDDIKSLIKLKFKHFYAGIIHNLFQDTWKGLFISRYRYSAPDESTIQQWFGSNFLDQFTIYADSEIGFYFKDGILNILIPSLAGKVAKYSHMFPGLVQVNVSVFIKKIQEGIHLIGLAIIFGEILENTDKNDMLPSDMNKLMTLFRDLAYGIHRYIKENIVTERYITDNKLNKDEIFKLLIPENFLRRFNDWYIILDGFFKGDKLSFAKLYFEMGWGKDG